MRLMQAKHDHSLSALQRDLRALLNRPGYSQDVVAKAVGVDQPVVSRAKNGELRRITPRVRKLCAYVENELGDVHVPQEVLRATKAYMGAGGDPKLLCDTISLLVAAIRPTSATVAE